jgi:hypothetical protein
MTDEKVLQLKITLVGSHPPIWRRVQVPEALTLAQLHLVIQISMGWQNSHFHDFNVKGVRYADFSIEDVGLAARDSTSVTLRDLRLRRKNQRFHYNYDFGDDWLHEIVVEAVLPPDPEVSLPVCLAGKRACPPEDCGGISGYEYLLEVIADPEHPDYEEMSEWIDPDFDPSTFDAEVVTDDLYRVFATA